MVGRVWQSAAAVIPARVGYHTQEATAKHKVCIVFYINCMRVE